MGLSDAEGVMVNGWVSTQLSHTGCGSSSTITAPCTNPLLRGRQPRGFISKMPTFWGKVQAKNDSACVLTTPEQAAGARDPLWDLWDVLLHLSACSLVVQAHIKLWCFTVFSASCRHLFFGWPHWKPEQLHKGMGRGQPCLASASLCPWDRQSGWGISSSNLCLKAAGSLPAARSHHRIKGDSGFYWVVHWNLPTGLLGENG